MSKKHHLILISFLLVIATACIYWQVLDHNFVNYDDNEYVTENLHIQKGLTLDSIAWAFTSSHSNNWHPLTWISHMMDYQFYTLNPKGHHLTSVLFHLSNTLLLFIILARMTGALWRSAFVAALFALHPLHVESVAWVAERKDVLSTFFMMLTIWAYLRYIEKKGTKNYLLVLLFFALGLMSKPMLVTLPFVLLLLDFWPLGRLGPEAGGVNAPTVKSYKKATTIQLIWEKTPFLALAMISSIITFLVQKSSGAVKSFEVYSLKVRIINAFVSYIEYVEKMLWPDGLAVLYPHPGDALPLWKGIAAAFVLSLISILVLQKARRFPYIAAGWFWYLVTLIPVIGIVQVGSQAMADRYTYITLIGLFFIIAWGIPDILSKWNYSKKVLPILAVAAITLLMALTWKQASHWQNSITLFSHTLDTTENNYLAHNNMGTALAREGNTDDAINHFETALSIMPTHANAHNNLGNALMDKGEIQEAFIHYRAALDADPGNAKAHNNIGAALTKTGNTTDAIIHYNKATKIDPDYTDAYFNLGNTLLSTGKLEEAISQYKTVIRINPGHTKAHYNLGTYLYKKGRLREAITHFRSALRTDPNSAMVHYNLGFSLFKLKQFEEAALHFSDALMIKPDFTDARNNLAIARQLLKKANE